MRLSKNRYQQKNQIPILHRNGLYALCIASFILFNAVSKSKFSRSLTVRTSYNSFSTRDFISLISLSERPRFILYFTRSGSPLSSLIFFENSFRTFLSVKLKPCRTILLPVMLPRAASHLQSLLTIGS